MKKQIITGIAAVALITAAGASTSHAAWLGGVDAKNDMSRKYDSRQDNRKDVDGNLSENSNNRSTKNQNSYNRDSRDLSNRSTNIDRHDYSNNSRQTDSRDLSDNSRESDSRRWTETNTSTVDSRNMSDNRQTTAVDSHDDNSIYADSRQDNQRHQSHNVGGAFFNSDVNTRAGHDTVNFGTVNAGQGNVMDASVNGNTFLIGSSTGK